jgi:pyruvate/2-oxoglutarate dehydrogenase complex dihydrolipoamide dehydrogenase (E3) component
VTAYDAIVIGTGQAGPSSAGMKVAVVDRNAFGGTCVKTGCIPTKTMVASACAARMAARAAEYGVDVGSERVDMKRVKARKDAVAKESRTGPLRIGARGSGPSLPTTFPSQLPHPDFAPRILEDAHDRARP